VRAQAAGGRSQLPASRGRQLEAEVAAAGVAVAGRQGTGKEEETIWGIWSRCYWWAGLGGEVGRRARIVRSVHGDANRAQIWAAFASPRIGRSKCVEPLGWVFPDPSQNRTNSDVRGPFLLGRWRCPKDRTLRIEQRRSWCMARMASSTPTQGEATSKTSRARMIDNGRQLDVLHAHHLPSHQYQRCPGSTMPESSKSPADIPIKFPHALGYSSEGKLFRLTWPLGSWCLGRLLLSRPRLDAVGHARSSPDATSMSTYERDWYPAALFWLLGGRARGPMSHRAI
jgi:hypothetical protein